MNQDDKNRAWKIRLKRKEKETSGVRKLQKTVKFNIEKDIEKKFREIEDRLYPH